MPKGQNLMKTSLSQKLKHNSYTSYMYIKHTTACYASMYILKKYSRCELTAIMLIMVGTSSHWRYTLTYTSYIAPYYLPGFLLQKGQDIGIQALFSTCTGTRWGFLSHYTTVLYLWHMCTSTWASIQCREFQSMYIVSLITVLCVC